MKRNTTMLPLGLGHIYYEQAKQTVDSISYHVPETPVMNIIIAYLLLVLNGNALF